MEFASPYVLLEADGVGDAAPASATPVATTAEAPTAAADPDGSLFVVDAAAVASETLPSSAPRRSPAPPGSPARASAHPPRWSPGARRPHAAAAAADSAGAVLRRNVANNVLSVTLGAVATAATMATGDAVLCVRCGAAFSAVSAAPMKKARVARISEWQCEFCGTHNAVNLTAEELPEGESLDYLLEPAPVADAPVPAAAPAAGAGVSADGSDSLVVFVMDLSGSMDSAVASSGVKPGEHMTRLQGVQVAVDAQLRALLEQQPSRRAAIITFFDDVSIVGDGAAAPVLVRGSAAADRIVQQVAECPLPGPVSESCMRLRERVAGMRSLSSTALGPAVLAAVALASRKRGSKVVLATDGEANMGLGALRSPGAAEFYTSVADYAVKHGVAIDVLGIEGHCNLETLGVMAERSGGEVQKLSPTALTHSLADILGKPIIATNVRATLLLHAAFKLVSADEVVEVVHGGSASRPEAAAAASSKAERLVGNAKKDSVITFEYTSKSREELAGARLDLRGVKALPFQLQIRYTRLDGATFLRVITQTREVTADRSKAWGELNMDVLSTHAMQQSGAMARAGDYERARVNAHAWGGFMQSHVRSPAQLASATHYVTEAQQLDSTLARALASEPVAARAATFRSSEHHTVSLSRRRETRTRDDHSSAAIYSFASPQRRTTRRSDE